MHKPLLCISGTLAWQSVVFLSPRRPPQPAFPHNQRLSTRQLWSLRKRGRPTIAYWVKSGVAGWCYKNDLSWIKSTSNPRRAAFRWICPVQGHWKKGGTKSQSEDFISLASAEPQTDVGPTRARAEQEDSHKKKTLIFLLLWLFPLPLEVGQLSGATGHSGKGLGIFWPEAQLRHYGRMFVMWREAWTTDSRLLLGSHVGHQVANAVAVSELVVIPGQKKNKSKKIQMQRFRDDQ